MPFRLPRGQGDSGELSFFTREIDGYDTIT